MLLSVWGLHELTISLWQKKITIIKFSTWNIAFLREQEWMTIHKDEAAVTDKVLKKKVFENSVKRYVICRQWGP